MDKYILTFAVNELGKQLEADVQWGDVRYYSFVSETRALEAKYFFDWAKGDFKDLAPISDDREELIKQVAKKMHQEFLHADVDQMISVFSQDTWWSIPPDCFDVSEPEVARRYESEKIYDSSEHTSWFYCKESKKMRKRGEGCQGVDDYIYNHVYDLIHSLSQGHGCSNQEIK